MSRLVGAKNTEGLLNSYDYTSLYSIIRALRQLLRLEEKAFKGNDAALILMADLKSGLDMYSHKTNILTSRQKEVIQLCLIEDMSETEVAERLGITQQTVHFIIRAGVRRIQKFLLTGEVPAHKFTNSDDSAIIQLYQQGLKPKQIAERLGKEAKSVRNKIKYLKRKGRIKSEGDDDGL
jgi:DNA-binding NarL/FixJ family response regulator